MQSLARATGRAVEHASCLRPRNAAFLSRNGGAVAVKAAAIAGDAPLATQGGPTSAVIAARREGEQQTRETAGNTHTRRLQPAFPCGVVYPMHMSRFGWPPASIAPACLEQRAEAFSRPYFPMTRKPLCNSPDFHGLHIT